MATARVTITATTAPERQLIVADESARSAMTDNFTSGEMHYHSSFACAMLASSALTRDCA